MFLNKKRIVKALVSTAVLTIIVTGLYGCGAGSAKTAVSDSKVNLGEYDMTAGASVSNPYTFTDDYGREVTVTSHKRAAALIEALLIYGCLQEEALLQLPMTHGRILIWSLQIQSLILEAY